MREVSRRATTAMSAQKRRYLNTKPAGIGKLVVCLRGSAVYVSHHRRRFRGKSTGARPGEVPSKVGVNVLMQPGHMVQHRPLVMYPARFLPDLCTIVGVQDIAWTVTRLSSPAIRNSSRVMSSGSGVG